MHESSPANRSAILAHWVWGTTLVFAFGEQLLGDLFVRSAYLASNLFYIPEVLLGAGVALGVGLAVCAACLLIGFLRPTFNATAATAACALPTTVYLFVVAYPNPPLNLISWAYGGRLRGQVLTVACVWLTVFLAIVAIQRLAAGKSPDAPKEKRNGRHWVIAALLGAIAAGLSFRPLYTSYAALNLVMIWALALPLLFAAGVYVWIVRKGVTRLLTGARIWFLFGVVVALVSLTRQYGSDSRGWILLTLAAVPTALVGIVLSRRAGRMAGVLSAMAPALLLFFLPVLEISWRAWNVWGSEPGEHVLLLTVDTLRRDALSAYNPDAPPTPNTDALLNDGVRFTHAWSTSSWTLPALVSIQTGVPPLVHRANAVDSRLVAEWETLAERFRDRGYATEAIVYNPLLLPERGLNQGFDRYWYFPEFGSATNLGQRLAKKIGLDRFEPTGSLSSMTLLALLRILRNREQPYFLWLHLFDPHPPYYPPARHWPEGIPQKDFTPSARFHVPGAERRQAAEAAYLAEVQYLDECMALLRKTLQSAGLYENLTVVFASDHGEEFWEKDRWGHGNPPTDTQVRVPLMIKPPGETPGAVTDRLTSTFEIKPMLLGLLEDRPRGAEDTTAWLSDFPRPSGAPEGLFSLSLIDTDYETEAIVFGEAPWKYMRAAQGDDEELYDLGADPAERRSLVEGAPERLQQGRELYLEHLAWGEQEGGRVEAGPDLELPPEVVDQLKAHGYLE